MPWTVTIGLMTKCWETLLFERGPVSWIAVGERLRQRLDESQRAKGSSPRPA